MNRGEVEPARSVWEEGSGRWVAMGEVTGKGSWVQGRALLPLQERAYLHYSKGSGALGLLPSEAREAFCESQTLLIMN